MFKLFSKSSKKDSDCCNVQIEEVKVQEEECCKEEKVEVCCSEEESKVCC